MSDQDFADAVGLVRSAPEEPGIVRQPWGRGFTFRWPDGSVVRGADRVRCEALAVPPAWEDVWICRRPDGHLQAVGTDDAGRRQYRYHDRWSEARSAANFDRLGHVGRRLAAVRRAIEADIRGDDIERRAVAAMVKVIDETLERVGNRSSVEHFGTRGISTLEDSNVDIEGAELRLTFVGKGGIDHDVTVDDDGELVDTIVDLDEAGGGWLFDVGGTAITASDANQYLAEHSSGAVQCKDLRTWGGSAVALTHRHLMGSSDVEIADAAAEALHNTRSVARQSYVHPAVFDGADREVDAAWSSSRRSRWYSRGERALLKLLESTPPLLGSHLAGPGDGP